LQIIVVISCKVGNIITIIYKKGENYAKN